MEVIKDKKTKQRLRGIIDGEEKFRTIFENVNDIIVYVDKYGKILDINKRSYELFGRKPEELIGKNFLKLDLFRIKDIPKMIKLFKDVIVKGKEIPLMELEIEDKKGKFIPVEASTKIIKKNGKIEGFLTIARDITDRKKAEEKLKESEEKFRNLVETTSDWIWEVDKNGVYTYASPKIKEILGYEPKEIIGKTPFDLMPKDEAKKIANIFGEIAKDKKVFHSLRNWNIHKNGGKVLLETSGVPILDEKGNLLGYRGIDRDITERIIVEEALQEAKNKLQTYFDTAGVIILVLNPELKILLINAKGCDILGYTLNEVLGKDWCTNFIPKGNRAEIKSCFEKLITEKVRGIQYCEGPILTKEGEKRFIAWHNTLLKNGQGQIQAILSTGGDITELTQAKSTIQQLKEFDRLKDDFLNIATHELKTPLTSIVGLSEIMKEQKSYLDPKYKNYINIIYEEGLKLTHIIKRILMVTRFESGRETVNIESFNLANFVSQLLVNLNIIANKRKMKVVTNVEEKSLVLRSDKEKISQLIYNLLDNAIKYGPEGQTITINILKPEKDWVKIEVKDEGPGIPPESQKKIFTKFAQLEPSLNRSQEGTGLGLYICKLIVDKLGGTIGVKSTLGKGSTFYFILPIQPKKENP